ncbi:MAG: hypothetical protein IJM88_01505 [Bacteroidales bacterium]|nr:hypothetical protein [Bacteroidales bacterium]
MKKAIVVSASVLKVLLGMLFVLSALMKFVSIDLFEAYVYSFGLVPLTLSFYVARLVLVTELILGAALISHRHHRFTVLMTLLYLLCFVVFLAYAAIVGRTDSCHCFGELMPFDPVSSLVKNAVLIVLLLVVYKYASRDWWPRWWLALLIYVVTAVVGWLLMRYGLHVVDRLGLVLLAVMLGVGLLASLRCYRRWYVTALLVAAPLVAVFILTPPDSWFYRGTHEVYDEALLAETLREPSLEATEAAQADTAAAGALADLGLDKGRHVVAFFSPGCGYCRLAAGKIATIAERCDGDVGRIVYVFPNVEGEERFEQFYEKARSPRYAERRIDKVLFVRITRGAFPMVMLMEDGEVKASFAYRNISEPIVCDWLTATE